MKKEFYDLISADYPDAPVQKEDAEAYDPVRRHLGLE